MTYRGLAVVFLRCSGMISAVIGLFHLAAYVPMIWDISPAEHGGAGILRTVLLPAAASVVGGVVLVAVAGLLGRIAARGVE